MAHQVAAPSDSGSGSRSASMDARTGSAPASGATSLPRGKACLRCRKRKMRCDGAHPACAQCVRAHKADTCQYDDGRGKTRTQALRERIVRLEAELQRLREGRGESSLGSPGAREDSVFLLDPHAPPPPPSSSGSENTFAELDFVDFGADAFGPGSGMDIERPATSLSDPSTSVSAPIFTSEPLSFDCVDEYEGGVQRNRTIRPRDHRLRTSPGLQEPRERPRPSSGVFGYSANHPLVQQAQAFGSPYQGQFQLGHSRTSSVGSVSPSSSTVGSIGGHGQPLGASPYSNYADPLSHEASPFPSPEPSMFSTAMPAFASMRLDRDATLDISSETEATLVQLVVAHRDQFGLAFHPGRLLASLSQPPELQNHHPVLKDALMLVGAYLARRACCISIISEAAEMALLKRAQAGLSDALHLASLQRPCQQDGTVSPPRQQSLGNGNESYTSPALDALQASVLLARYLFAEGRSNEARMHVVRAGDLVLQLGLHQLFSNGPSNESGACRLHIQPPSDSVALGECVALFWVAFVLDRMVATALNLPPCIVDDECVETRIDTPWPEDVEEYENIPMESVHGSATLRNFFVHQGIQVAGVSLGGFSLFALLAKASALYAACARTSANWGIHSLASPPPAIVISSSTSPASTTAQDVEQPSMVLARLEACLARLASTLLPAHQLGAGIPDSERRKQVVLHTLIHASVVRLHSRLAQAGVGASLDKCVRAARAAAALTRAHVGEKDYALFDPVFESCWIALADVFTWESIRASAATPGCSASAWVPHDHGALVSSLAHLQGSNNAQAFPLDSTPSLGK
ncbi:hypothetical protein ACEPAI_8199 [Sanghuangporus weigelae]